MAGKSQGLGILSRLVVNCFVMPWTPHFFWICPPLTTSHCDPVVRTGAAMFLRTMASSDWSGRRDLIETGSISPFAAILDLGPRERASPSSYW